MVTAIEVNAKFEAFRLEAKVGKKSMDERLDNIEERLDSGLAVIDDKFDSKFTSNRVSIERLLKIVFGKQFAITTTDKSFPQTHGVVVVQNNQLAILPIQKGSKSTYKTLLLILQKIDDLANDDNEDTSPLSIVRRILVASKVENAKN
ncbi:unnamed protein product [Dovyalis caffra]|uniref:Uncharacterized protein n=1 Tax=Dovyalis caffra TaxID=77055 RepID=A0AAV1SJL4_9ROSI|nr:unnamed protein product [Dovyalis caffra]